ncbi:hypothetical protein AN239_12200, partial [Neisseria gonorrhoeae]
PPDIISQTLLAIPLILLYEAGIWFGRFFTPRSEQDGDIQPPAKNLTLCRLKPRRTLRSTP